MKKVETGGWTETFFQTGGRREREGGGRMKAGGNSG